jgi:hypothetical protein
MVCVKGLRCWIVVLFVAGATFHAAPGAAVRAGDDVLVPAAARVASWVTDLIVFNPGEQATDLTVYWLERNQDNSTPEGYSFSLEAGAALVLDDVIREVLGRDEASGAFRIVSDHKVVVTTRIYNLRDGVTFGQGFEGVPRAAAVAAGSSTDIAGLTHNDSFRTNVVVIDASGVASEVELSLRDVSGAELSSKTYFLAPFEPRLNPLTSFPDVAEFDNGTLHATVVSGAAIIVASKVDNDPETGDPTTLEAWTEIAESAFPVDGTYQLAIYDSEDYATGGYLAVRNSNVTDFHASYTNWDKGGQQNPDCPNTFLFGSPELGLHPIVDFVAGVEFSQEYAPGATITWTVSFEQNQDSPSLAGTVEAVGNGFTGLDAGCNGAFPPLLLRAGKSD